MATRAFFGNVSSSTPSLQLAWGGRFVDLLTERERALDLAVEALGAKHRPAVLDVFFLNYASLEIATARRTRPSSEAENKAEESWRSEGNPN